MVKTNPVFMGESSFFIEVFGIVYVVHRGFPFLFLFSNKEPKAGHAVNIHAHNKN